MAYSMKKGGKEIGSAAVYAPPHKMDGTALKISSNPGKDPDRSKLDAYDVSVGGISKSAAQKQLDQLQAEFRVLEKQAATLAANPQILINVSAIDTEGAARAVAKALNSSAARSTPALDYAAIREKAG